MIELPENIKEFLKSEMEWINFVFKSKDNFELRTSEVIDLINNDIKDNNFDYEFIPQYIEMCERYELYEVCDYLKTLQK